MHPRNRQPYQDDEEWDPNELHRSKEPEQRSDESATEFEEFVDGDPIVEDPDEAWNEDEWPE